MGGTSTATEGNLRLLNLIGGEWVDSEDTIVVRNPATGEVVGTVPAVSSDNVQQALEAAKNAFPEWGAKTAYERAKLLHAAADIVRDRRDHIARILTSEQGKPLRDAEKEVAEAAYVLDYFAEEGIRVFGEIIPMSTKNTLSMVVKQPIGPVVAIAPWNYPVSLLAWKVAPALATGCTVVAKPASETPLADIEYVRCLVDAGIPSGVINIVTGRGSVVGDSLINNDIAKKVAFTGSDDTGSRVLRLAADHIKKVSLELGGHSPFIVFPDADLDAAAVDGAKRAFRAMGQNCNSVNRIYVHQSVFDSFMERMVEYTKTLKIGNGLENPDIDLGPMVNEEGINRTLEHINDAVARGAKVIVGGKKPEGKEYENGCFFEPTIVSDAPTSAKILNEESFGPVVNVQSFSTTEEAIQLSNNSKYGLVSYVYTNDLSLAHQVSNALECGTVCVNNTAGSTVEAPYGGWKTSGTGVELSHYGLDSYLQLKHIRIQLRAL